MIANTMNLILNVLNLPRQSSSNYIFICISVCQNCVEYPQQIIRTLPTFHFRCTGSVSWIWMPATAWLKPRCIWIKQKRIASINLCVEIKASHTWKAGSQWFPLELGLVAMGEEGTAGRGKKIRETRRKTASSVQVQYFIMHSLP